MQYNRIKATEYAKTWWNKRNPDFFDFENIGGDCTNFVSQCLYFGGLDMNFFDWYYKTANVRSYSWTGVNELFVFLTNNKGAGPQAILTSQDDVELGDIIQLKRFDQPFFHHTALITKIENQRIYFTCHTDDLLNFPLEYYPFDQIRFLKIIN